MFPSPKYEIGQRVFFASAVDMNETFPCKSCAGSGQWRATSAEGETGHCDCPACGGRGSRALYSYGPSVCPRTIGSVRVDTSDTENPVSYMCHETGVGSGNIYRENQLFPTEQEAVAAAEGVALAARLRADEQNTDRALHRKLWLKPYSDQRTEEAERATRLLRIKLDFIQDTLRDMHDTAGLYFSNEAVAKTVIEKIATQIDMDLAA